MYLEHFALRELPFSITPDTSYFFASGSSQEALNTLLIAVRTGEGFIKIVGEVGTGKSLLCRKLMASLGEEYQVAYIPNPYLEPLALFTELAAELGLEPPEGGPGAPPPTHLLVKLISQRLLDIAAEGRFAVVCLDEAQAMPVETLEALRLLTNLETEKRKLLQVVIFGQPELEEKLDHPSVRQLKQRIAFDYRLGPLSRAELGYYLHHRLVVAGYRGGPLFTAAAVRLLRRRTRCVPRLVNIVAHKALLSAYGKGRRAVGAWDVLSATQDTAATRSAAGWQDRAGLLLLVALSLVVATYGWMVPR
ncbi:ExeA family protein [Pelomonas sp. KK5]|uniref:ExeA family protein n=1 Tax=Pelomonas sp. KK5 TaxID=1855730 RepID=UPI00097BEF5C|nr:AAA family ATPase [Pelomonas sp. KK5]